MSIPHLASALSNTANIVSAAANLSQQNSPELKDSIHLPPKQKTMFIELNGTLVDLYEVALIRKSKNDSRCFVIVLRSGQKELTAPYTWSTDFDSDYKRIIEVMRMI